MKITIEESGSGMRLDKYLMEYFKTFEITRSSLEKQIKGNVSINNKSTKKGYFLRVGDVIEFDEASFKKTVLETDEIVSVKGDIDIIEEDSDYMVINKPKGVPVHPGKGHEKDTIANYLRYYLESKGEWDPALKRAGIVHRLDLEVSGLMIVAKTRQRQLYLQQKFEANEVIKVYLATLKSTSALLPKGELELEDVLSSFIANNYEPDKTWERIEGYIARDPSDRKRMKLSLTKGKTGRYALSYLMHIQNNQTLFNIKTGRMHQIRATAKALGWVVKNDKLYGDTKPEGEMELKEILLKLQVVNDQPEKVWKLV